jgi:ABC-type lipoprotein export system ATPase subunit/GNAT superfamily N-acetyltransferase
MEKTVTVLAINGGKKTEINCSDGERLSLRPFLYLSPGDRLIVEKPEQEPRATESDGGATPAVWKLLDGGQRIPLHPPFMIRRTIRVGHIALELAIRERASADDWNQAKALERYHYRGTQIKFIPGRRTVLVAEVTKGPAELVGRIVGYAVLASALPAVSVRLRLLGQSFGDHMKTRTINRFVRIPRVVVAPELRGIGLGTLIAKACVRYAKERWEVKGWRPWAVEVVAAMTDYHPFFTRAGFVLMGYTLAKPEAIKPVYGGGGTWGSRPDSESYNFRTFDNAKPYLLFPLTPSLKQQVRRFLGATTPGLKTSSPGLNPPVAVVKNLTCSVQIAATTSEKASVVAQAFGLLDSDVEREVRLFSLKELQVGAGDVVLIGGPSGSGKTLLARLLSGIGVDSRLKVTGEISLTAGVPAEFAMTELPEDSLVDILGTPLTEAIQVLSQVGLSEPRLYQRSPSTLSVGQLHRLRAAILASSRASIWLADDLGASLDDLAACVLAKGLASLARKRNATLFVTSASPHRISQALAPDLVLDIGVDGIVTRGVFRPAKPYERRRMPNRSERLKPR